MEKKYYLGGDLANDFRTMLRNSEPSSCALSVYVMYGSGKPDSYRYGYAVERLFSVWRHKKMFSVSFGYCDELDDDIFGELMEKCFMAHKYSNIFARIRGYVLGWLGFMDMCEIGTDYIRKLQGRCGIMCVSFDRELILSVKDELDNAGR